MVDTRLVNSIYCDTIPEKLPDPKNGLRLRYLGLSRKNEIIPYCGGH